MKSFKVYPAANNVYIRDTKRHYFNVVVCNTHKDMVTWLDNIGHSGLTLVACVIRDYKYKSKLGSTVFCKEYLDDETIIHEVCHAVFHYLGETKTMKYKQEDPEDVFCEIAAKLTMAIVEKCR